ncbi:LETM1like protein [Acanthamoeba castellanii str. Neff]|uniref:LETM1like protein n=1 Tax=Acanthamoeba castellanii (strain ATCC 30010 / Neff) TaxID=1257118 RepID=L8HJX5_ACACF|nr:LETM1like protein [Acanthamoeba castellanii str. Neff]ELR25507.1 LETM1like protein [Acanthamoeba castellanii str. Neff]
MWAQYWGGTRQLWVDAGAARALRRRVRESMASGGVAADGSVALSRRETRFVRRVADDVRALVPFLAFFMLPFSAYALPVIVRFFPGFLPSTYHSSSYRVAQMQKRQKVKVEAARQLRDALSERLLATEGPSARERDLLLDFIHRAAAGEAIPLTQLRPLDRYFATHLKLLDLEPRRSSGASLGSWLGSTLWLCPAELRALCTFYGLSALPLPTFDHCANQLILHASRIQHDDKLLVQEGDRWPTELTDEELLEACDERGLPTDVTERDRLVAQINQWLAFRRPPPPVSAELTLFAPALATNTRAK